MPSTWEMYGVDANNDGRKDPYNPVDAICAAASYLKAAGGNDGPAHRDLRLQPRRLVRRRGPALRQPVRRLPADLVGSLTGLTEGARFPVAADSRYADDISEREAAASGRSPAKGSRQRLRVVSYSPTRRGINIYSQRGRAGDRRQRRRRSSGSAKTKKLGKYIVLEDAYGNRFTYAELGEVAKAYPVPKERKLTAKDDELVEHDETPTAPAPQDLRAARRRQGQEQGRQGPPARQAERRRGEGQAPDPQRPVNTEDLRDRIYALPRPPGDASGPARLSAASSRRCAPSPPSTLQAPRLRRRPSVQPEDDGAGAARGGLEGRRRHRARPDRRRGRADGAAPQLLDPPRRRAARRRSTRSRSSTAGSCWRRRRSTGPPAGTRSPAPTPRRARCC